MVVKARKGQKTPPTFPMSHPRNHSGRFPSPLQEVAEDRTGQDEGPPPPQSQQVPAGPGLRPAQAARPAAWGALSSAGARRPHSCPTQQPRSEPPTLPDPGAPSPPVPPAAISGRRQFKKRAAALTPPPIGCRPHRPSVNLPLIRHGREMPRLLARNFRPVLRPCPNLIGQCTCHSRGANSHWLWGVSWADAQRLLRHDAQVTEWAEGRALRWLAAGMDTLRWLAAVEFERSQRPRGETRMERGGPGVALPSSPSTAAQGTRRKLLWSPQKH